MLWREVKTDDGSLVIEHTYLMDKESLGLCERSNIGWGTHLNFEWVSYAGALELAASLLPPCFSGVFEAVGRSKTA